ncbi:hypothetical protein SAMN05421774_101892 [Gemmobacter megaterium]|uniref:Uncharacterized protein n=1 Tax=Gemmobacter megaterium TaxID=1086013 RepID=A0A1N7L4D9_9RHOB|nr:DUF6880 family protein [Gemmobacter megaterium]GGE05476.1 hypothetical protein GCM10011345_08790 [Gemmobacter megaterium]SIS68540.1 hypothetical protein SAMN05421774_101892 [Gemmobacter megaterium]
MARKPALSTESLTALGAEKLAELVLDEAQANAGFKRRVNAALAGKTGPEAIAKLIDRRLSGLERARAFIDWDKARAFQGDLQGLCDSIVKELCPADADLGASRLIRFIATHDQVFQRVDDSSGKLQDIYWEAIEATGPVSARLSATDLPQFIMVALGETEHGYLKPVAERVVPHLPSEVLAAWDVDLSERIAERDSDEAGQRARERWFHSMTRQWREIRQMIAAASGDLDRLILIETEKPERDRDTLDIARRLLDAERPAEALDWVRRGGPQTHLRPFGIEGEDEDPPDRSPLVRQSELEARILRALDRMPEALALLWDRFRDTLAPALLRAHLKMLPDFEDMEAEERAMTLALEHPDTMAALNFLLAWQRRDLAAQLVVARHAEWQGRDWHILPEVAEQLQHEQPLAASILFRALLDDILGRARSKAYGHGAKYLRQLDLLAAGADADPARPVDFDAHEAYRAKLRTDHGRKSGFWARFGEPLSAPKSEPSWRGRRPLWTSDS